MYASAGPGESRKASVKTTEHTTAGYPGIAGAAVRSSLGRSVVNSIGISGRVINAKERGFMAKESFDESFATYNQIDASKV